MTDKAKWSAIGNQGSTRNRVNGVWVFFRFYLPAIFSALGVRAGAMETTLYLIVSLHIQVYKSVRLG